MRLEQHLDLLSLSSDLRLQFGLERVDDLFVLEGYFAHTFKVTRLLSLRFPFESVNFLRLSVNFLLLAFDFGRMIVIKSGLGFGSLSHFRLEAIVVFDVFLSNLVDGGADHLAWGILSRADTLDQAWQAVMGGILAAGCPSQALFTSHGNCLAVALSVGRVLRFTFVESSISALKDA